MNKESIYKLTQNYLITYPNDVHALQVLEFLEKYDNFWQRDNSYGHITASGWVINKARDKALLTHHIKFNMWVQLGGHIEIEDNTIIDACLRELQEESGLTDFKLLSEEIFDIDVHLIPMNSNGFPEHFHFDIRLLFEASEDSTITHQIEESNEVRWLKLDELEMWTNEKSVLRMVEKTLNLIE